MNRVLKCNESNLKDAAGALKAGNLVAFPTETVYGLGADATNQVAVARVYEVKGRPTDHPLIVHISSINRLENWVRDIPDYAIKLANSFWPGPLTLILPRSKLAKDFITGGQENVGVRVPNNPCAFSLLEEFESLGGLGIAAPSANRFSKVSPTSAEDVIDELSLYLSVNDIVLDGGRSIVGLESTIIDCTKSRPLILRPGGITNTMVTELLGQTIDTNTKHTGARVKAPGLLESHYSPNAKIFLTGTPAPGDGFIALSKVATPSGAIRLISPRDNNEYARSLYGAMRFADTMKITKVYVCLPEGDDIAVAICDRLSKAAFKSIHE